MTLRDEASLIAVKGVADVKFRVAYIAIVCKVRGVDALAQEDGILTLLHL